MNDYDKFSTLAREYNLIRAIHSLHKQLLPFASFSFSFVGIFSSGYPVFSHQKERERESNGYNGMWKERILQIVEIKKNSLKS